MYRRRRVSAANIITIMLPPLLGQPEGKRGAVEDPDRGTGEKGEEREEVTGHILTTFLLFDIIGIR
jgi:hypothetical protein